MQTGDAEIIPEVVNEPEAAVPEEPINPVFSRIGSDGVVIAQEKVWYLEEFDSLGRPIAGTYWENGSIVRHISWEYEGEDQQAETKTEKTNAGEIKTAYDFSGKTLFVIETNTKGDIIKKTSYEYAGNHLPAKTVVEDENETITTLTKYNDDDSVSEKWIYRNDELVISYFYKNEDDWTETIYLNNAPILIVEYENGIRKKGTR
ncbi:hypothetical protein K7I13_00885 [Brucepastera parasyntrophica]|uniref:hypothetical protein n=1 Tax=Brucepastera parasyntrophica TaxID=2880008 RepID=UPI00210B4C56|nr:hypothetical protein [Brucepastera parasyntrophica]ULQ59934.1 hypothetical protein K7I13_00885 [Brucepastera parasyntrophica]